MSSSPAITELLDRVRDQYNEVDKELVEVKTENRKLAEEKSEINRMYVMSTEMLNAANLEKMTQIEIVKRLESLIQNNIAIYPQEQQQGVMDAVARLKQVDQHDIMARMQSQAVATGMAPYTMHMPAPNGGIVYTMPPGAAPGQVPVPPPGMMAHLQRFPMQVDHGQHPVAAQASGAEYNNNHDSRSKHPHKKRKHETENHDHDEDVDVSGTDVDKSNNGGAGVHNNGAHNGSAHSHHDSGRDSKPSSDREHRKKSRQAATTDTASSTSVVAAVAQPMHHPGMMPATSQDGQIVFANGGQMFSFPPGMRPPFMQQPMSMMQTHYQAPAGTEIPPIGYPGAAPPGAYYQLPPGAYARPPFDTNHHRQMPRTVPAQQVTQLPVAAAPVPAPVVTQAPPGSKQPVTYHYSENKMSQITPQSDFYTHPGMARSVTAVSTLQHNDVVCAVSIDSKTRRVYTGGKGVVKVWKMEQANCETPLWQFDILDDSYIRSCKVLPDGNTMIVGGESTKLALYDLEAKCRIGELTSMAPACYAVAISSDGQLVYSCCSNGQIVIWDMRTRRVEKQIHGHSDGASCLDLARDGTRLVTGGLDCKVRIWDTRQTQEIKSYEYDSQVFSIGYTSMPDSGEKYVAVGLENSTIEMFNINRPERYVSHLHEDAVLSLKFSSSGKWFVTTSKDTKLGVWGMPCGASLFHTKESRSILCCDVSADDKHIITGSGHNRAMLYEVQY